MQGLLQIYLVPPWFHSLPQARHQATDFAECILFATFWRRSVLGSGLVPTWFHLVSSGSMARNAPNSQASGAAACLVPAWFRLSSKVARCIGWSPHAWRRLVLGPNFVPGRRPARTAPLQISIPSAGATARLGQHGFKHRRGLFKCLRIRMRKDRVSGGL